MVLAYVESKDNDFVLITLALYDTESDKWIDMMREKDNQTNISVVQWMDIPEVNIPWKWFTSFKMHKYREIYINNVSDRRII